MRMVKKHLLRKGVAYLLSAAMVLTGTGGMPSVTKTVSAAVNIPEPVIDLDFNGTTTDSTYTEDGINYTFTDSKIIEDPDNSGNKVFYNNKDGETESKKHGFMKSEEGVFANTNFSNGISVHMKVRPNTQTSDWNYLFSLGYNNDGWHYVDGTIGFVMRAGDPYEAHFPKGNWQPGNTLGGSADVDKFDYFKQAENCDKWYYLTYVYGADGNFAIYVNGVLAVSSKSDKYSEIFSGINNKNNIVFSLGCGIDSTLEKCNAYYDDVQVYNATLTNAQVRYLVTGEEGSADSLISNPTATINDSQLEIGYTEDIKPDSVEVSVGGTEVEQTDGKYLYTPSKAGEYEIVITAKKDGYISDKETLTIKVALEDGKLVWDEELVKDLKVSSDGTKLSVSWTPLSDAAAVTAEVVPKEGEERIPVTDGSAELSNLVNEKTYTVVATAKKDGCATKTVEKTFVYKKGKPFEVLTGTEWWKANEAGKDYVFSGNGTMVLDVDFIGPEKEEKGAFSVEAKDNAAETKYITTGSDINVWGAGCGESYNYVDCVKQTNTKITPGHKYRITIERNNSEFAITYYDVTADKQHCKMTSSACVLTDDFNVHVMAQVGSFQVYKLDDSDIKETDKTKLNAAISEAEKVMIELYTEETATAFNNALNAAKKIKLDISAEQNAVDAATDALVNARKALILKSVDLVKDLVLDSDMTSVSSVIDKENKKVIAGGHTITALGTSSIEDGYIQSSESGQGKKAGISLDKSVLDGVSLDKGLTFNIKWQFSTAPPSDWWDLISIVDEKDAYLMRSTVGFINFTEGNRTPDKNPDGTDNYNVYPGSDCKNGFAWDSCKSYETGIVKNLSLTIDNTGVRMYVDGVLACEKTDMGRFDFGYVFEHMAKIYIGYAVNPNDGDLQGQLHGLQVYQRALNAAEIDKLAGNGTGTSFGLSSVSTLVKRGETQTISISDASKPSDTKIISFIPGDNNIATAEIKNGELVITGASDGKTNFIVNTSYGQSASCNVTVYTNKVDVQSIVLDKQTASIEEGGTLTLVANVLPENATDDGIIWESDNERVATVDSNGIVTAVAEGTATITAKSNENNAISASCTITVTERVNLNDVITDESQLGTYNPGLAYKRVGVHDPSVVQDPKTKRYYIFGSHCAWAWSDDLENWTAFTNNITQDSKNEKGEDIAGSANTIFKDEIEWCKKSHPDYTITGNLWAPDVIWDADYKNKDGTKGAWLMYMSINGLKWNSTISLLTSDSLDGDWNYVGPVIQSGMSTVGEITFDYQKVTGETTVNSRYTSNIDSHGTPGLEAHAIDPCVLYDDNGDLWMSYGSWSGGISMIKLDKETGLRDYNTKYTDTNNQVKDGFIQDPYTGYKIAGGNTASGEGSYIQKIGDYYYLFLSYGFYSPTGGYNMRIFRSKDIKGPYTDVAGNDARTAVNAMAGSTIGTTGMRLMSYYKWSFADYGYTAQGHNSAIVDENGKAYVIYHNKYNDGTAAHEVRVHQLLTNEDGWILSAPFEYAGETVNSSGYSQDLFTGDYGIMFQRQSINHEKLQCIEEKKIKLEEGTQAADGTYTGNITGDYTGTWTSKEGSPYVTLDIGGTTYKGVFCDGTIDETDVQTMTFTAVGDNQECLWGYKISDPTVAINMTINEIIKFPDEVATDIKLPTAGAGGSTITWRSNSVAINDDGTVPHLFNKDTKASMTAIITNGGKEFEKVYEFTVVGNERLINDSDVVLEKFYADEALDMSTLKQGSTPKFANPFYYTSADISKGASISFDVVRTAESDRLSNIISFNNKLGKLYFTGGSYLGYNDFNDHYIDANLKPGYVQGEDYLADNTKVTIKIEIDSNGFTVYKDGVKAYSSSEVPGTVPGGKSNNSPERTILSWLKTAPELNFGSGNFWNDIFQGTISDVTCSYKQPAINIGSTVLAQKHMDTQKVYGIYTSDSYKALEDAVASGNAEGINTAINGLVRKDCVVTVEDVANGTVTGLAADGKYTAGDYVILKAVPSEGYSFEGWKIGEKTVGRYAVYSAMVTGDITIKPMFGTEPEPTPTPIPTPTPSPTGSAGTPTPTPTGTAGSSTATPAPTPSAGSGTPAPTESGSGGGSYIPGPVTPNQPGGGTGPSVPSANPNPGTSQVPAPSTAPGASQEPSASTPPSASQTPAPGTDIKVDEETGVVTETTTKTDGNKTIVTEKVIMPDGSESVKETVTEDTGALTNVTETLTDSSTDSILVTEVTSDSDGNVIDASAVISTGGSDIDSQYSVKTIIPKSYFENVRDAGLDSVDIYVEKPTVDNVKEKIGPKMLIKIAVPDVDGVSVRKVIVTKDSIESAKESSKKLVVKIQNEDPSKSYTVTIPQGQLKKMGQEIDVSVKTGKVSGMGSSNRKKVNKILSSNKVGEDNSYTVAIASNNTKGGIKVTTPAMLPSAKQGGKVYVYSYNKKTGKLEEVPNSQTKVIKGGEVAIEGFSGNTYVVTDKELSGKKVVGLLDKTKVSLGKASVKKGGKTKVKLDLGTGLVAKPSVKSSTSYAKQAAVVTYKSSDPKKVKVSKDGTITAKGKGKAKITVKIKLAGGKVKTVKKNVTVK